MSLNKQKVGSRLSNKICPDGMTIEEWQIALRRENAREVGFQVTHLDDNRIWGDYLVSSDTGRYRTAFRGVCSDRNFCSCLDFRTNGLGTCKHLEAVTLYLQEHVPGYPWAGMSFTPPYSSIYVSYKGGRSIRMRIGNQYTAEYLALYQQYFSADGELLAQHYGRIAEIADKAKAISASFRIYDDVYEYAEEVTRAYIWQADLSESFEEKRIPWDRMSHSSACERAESLLYSLCYSSDALLVAPEHPTLIQLIGRLVEEIYQGLDEIAPGYIVLENEYKVKEWQRTLSAYPELLTLPVRLLSEEQFLTTLRNDFTASLSLVYVDRADELKQWQNPLSIAIKKLKIEHLYMRIDSLEHLTPVQLSSILQHINPFIMGPFYRFIHLYRPGFPLKDDGSNMPVEISSSIHLCPDIASLLDEDSTPSLLALMETSSSGQSALKQVLESVLKLAESPESLSLLRQLLHKL